MAETSIEWTHQEGTVGRTLNPTTGCDKISPGCDNCYALTMAKRLKAMGQAKYQNDGDPRTSGPGFDLTIHPDVLDEPLRWRKPATVFVNSMSDLFHARVPRDFIAQFWDVMARTPQHTYQILTKRPERMARVLADVQPLANVWLGTSIELDKYTSRADALRKTPAAVRFISAEPLLGALPSLDLAEIDWLIAGGESGPGARPMHPEWVRDLRDRCVRADVAFFFKQWGSWRPGGHSAQPCRWVGLDGQFVPAVVSGAVSMVNVGKKEAGRKLDGWTWNQYPTRDKAATR